MEFQNICNEMVAPFFLRHPVGYRQNDINLVYKLSFVQWCIYGVAGWVTGPFRLDPHLCCTEIFKVFY